MREVLSREEVIKAIERRRPCRVPMILHHYAPPRVYGERAAEMQAILREYPMDVRFHIQHMPSIWEEPGGLRGYSWMRRPAPPATGQARGMDAEVAITDWAQLDEVLAHPPDPEAGGRSPCDEDPYEGAGRYSIIHWWNCLYEKAWKLRGMENLLMDFHLNPEPARRLLDAITDFSCGVIRRAARDLRVEGVWVTDDIGMQTGPMFGLDIFREFFKPCYERLFRTAHENHMHFWLHSCGNIEVFLPDLIEIGVDVIHPIQKHTMDMERVAARYGGQVCFWAGMDAQRILPGGTPDDVRRETRFLVDTFDRCMLALGNVVTADVPLENLRAFFDESYRYGLAHRRKFD